VALCPLPRFWVGQLLSVAWRSFVSSSLTPQPKICKAFLPRRILNSSSGWGGCLPLRLGPIPFASLSPSLLALLIWNPFPLDGLAWSVSERFLVLPLRNAVTALNSGGPLFPEFPLYAPLVSNSKVNSQYRETAFLFSSLFKTFPPLAAAIVLSLRFLLFVARVSPFYLPRKTIVAWKTVWPYWFPFLYGGMCRLNVIGEVCGDPPPVGVLFSCALFLNLRFLDESISARKPAGFLPADAILSISFHFFVS